MPTPNETSVLISLKTQRRLSRLHAEVGDYHLGSGYVMRAYTSARQILEVKPRDRKTIRDVFYNLRDVIGPKMASSAVAAETLGITQATETFEALGLELPQIEENQDIILEYLDSVDLMIRRQQAVYLGLVLSGESSLQFLTGTGPDWGVLSPRPVITSIKNYLTSILNSVLSRVVTGQPGMGYQAVAILDKKTSPCCRAVDGQVQPIGRPFHLTEPPSYAEYMEMPPFHDGCRTTRALVNMAEATYS